MFGHEDPFFAPVATIMSLGAHENISASVLVGYTQATAADMLRVTGPEREPAHDLVGRAAVAAHEDG